MGQAADRYRVIRPGVAAWWDDREYRPSEFPTQEFASVQFDQTTPIPVIGDHMATEQPAWIGQPGDYGDPQPTWNPEPGGPPPPKPPRRHRKWWILGAAGVGALLLLAFMAVVIASPEFQEGYEAGMAPATRVPTQSTNVPGDTSPDVTENETPPEAQPDSPPIGNVGDTLELSEYGTPVAKITVGGLTHPSKHKGVRINQGGEFDDPQHGYYAGFWLKVEALEDGVDIFAGDFHVNKGGQHYEEAITTDGFKPGYSSNTLSKGETAQGWIVFDVPARHGQVVMTDYDGKKLGSWKF